MTAALGSSWVQSPGLDAVAFSVVSTKCAIDVRRAMWGNVCVSGGTTLLPGFVDRLVAGTLRRAPGGVVVRAHAPANRGVLPWIGGSVMASLSVFEDKLVTRGAYDDMGSCCVDRCSAWRPAA